MCGAALLALLHTHGNVSAIVVMYSINVFLTFSLSMLGMLKHWLAQRKEVQHWRRQAALFAVGLLLCAAILAVTVWEKFAEGGWLTVLITGALVSLAFIVRQHYGTVYAKVSELYQEDMLELAHIPADEGAAVSPLDPSQPTAVLLVGAYSGLGIHTMLSIFRMFPGYYKNLLFVTVGVVDSGMFKGEETVDALRKETEGMLERYLRLARRLRIPCECDYELGTDAVNEAEKLCRRLHLEFPKATFFAGKIVFHRERWYQRLLHNETAFAIQRRLQWSGQTMVIIPARMV
jgi:hypothetical protein